MSVKTGYAAIIGKPNAGKSTLMNALLGEKISIVTRKPQTTRKRVLGIFSDENYQIIFLDTPGILNPRYLLQEKLLDYVSRSINDADILIYIYDISESGELDDFLNHEIVKNSLKQRKKKLFLVNKIDLSDDKKVKQFCEKIENMKLFESVVPISAILNFNIDNILEQIKPLLPEHPKLYPDDQVSDETERFFVSEIIREVVFEQYRDEIPYSIEVLINDFKEREGRKDFIAASIIVERNSQKPIVIGEKGTAIKKLGQTARAQIEEFLGRPVYLELRVKVKANWRSDPFLLKYFGYSRPDE